MKTTRFLLAAALAVAAAACSADVTAPQRNAPAAYGTSAAMGAADADTTTAPRAGESSGWLGSGNK